MWEAGYWLPFTGFQKRVGLYLFLLAESGSLKYVQKAFLKWEFDFLLFGETKQVKKNKEEEQCLPFTKHVGNFGNPSFS